MKDNQRRAQIFNVLDDFKSRNEKITAQKLAAQVKMGKQTVLPYYREWQELEILGDDEELELSQELVRVLRREIAKEKFRQGEKTRDLQDELDERTYELAESREEWSLKCKELEDRTKHLEQKCSQLEQSNIELQKHLTDSQGQVKSQKERAEQLTEQHKNLENRLDQEIRQGKEALVEQEGRLDEAHQKIINHWMKVIDEERREKGRLQKHLERLQETGSRREKELHETVAAMEAEKRLVTSLKSANSEQKSLIELMTKDQSKLNQLAVSLGNPADIDAEIAKLKAEAELSTQLERQLLEQTSKVQVFEKNSHLKDELEQKNRALSEQVIRLEAQIEGIQMAGGLKAAEPS